MRSLDDDPSVVLLFLEREMTKAARVGAWRDLIGPCGLFFISAQQRVHWDALLS